MSTQPEARLSTQIRKAMEAEAKTRGYSLFIFKVHGSEMQMAGVPDLLACYRGIFLGIESKMPGNKLSDIQAHRIKTIRRAEGLCVVAYSVTDALSLLDEVDKLHLSR